MTAQQPVTRLPTPQTRGQHSLEELIAARRSVRSYGSAPMTLPQLSQILWSAQGTTSADGKRSVPSAGARYPLELYVAATRVAGLQPGVYRFVTKDHSLARVSTSDVAACLVKAAGDQNMLAQAAVVLVFVAAPARSTRYGARAARFIAIEVGAAMQDVYLQATSLGLGTVAVGTVEEPQVRRCVPLGVDEAALLMMPVGPRQ
ncbi:MAG TPA: SagB/ThcOx family dehydrogenase [Longimicrobiales bacterium]